MRILHTADWHMNDVLGARVDRSDDIVAALKRIAAYLDQEHVDVMLVAGDIIERGPLPAMRRAVRQVRDIFLPFLERGGTIVAISGNHDSEVFFEALRDTLDMGAAGRTGRGNTHATGRLYIAPQPRLLRLADAHGTVVQFVLMPYPTSRYLQGHDVQYRNTEEKHRLIQQRFKQTLDELEIGIDRSQPSVLVSHIHVRGVRVHERYALTEAEDIIFEPSDIPTHWAYVAYGHMHKPQPALPNAAHIRYAGSIERLDAGDIDDEKGVVVVDIGPEGLEGEPRVLPLEATPIYRLEVHDPDAEIPLLAERYPDAERALVHYTLYYEPSKHHPQELCLQIEAIFPRWYGRAIHKLGDSDEKHDSPPPPAIHDVGRTVREYLTAQLPEGDERDAVLALAEQLLAEEVGQ
jgi:DNA repair protein SbcD/Mre11